MIRRQDYNREGAPWKFFAYLTPSCLEDARRHSLETEVKKLARKVESDQSISAWDNFVPHPYVKKSLG